MRIRNPAPWRSRGIAVLCVIASLSGLAFTRSQVAVSRDDGRNAADNWYYHGAHAAEVQYLLGHINGWQLPSCARCEDFRTPDVPINRNIGQRDAYVATAALNAFGAEANAKFDSTAAAERYAATMIQNLQQANALCGNNATVRAPGTTPATLGIWPCPPPAGLVASSGGSPGQPGAATTGGLGQGSAGVRALDAIQTLANSYFEERQRARDTRMAQIRGEADARASQSAAAAAAASGLPATITSWNDTAGQHRLGMLSIPLVTARKDAEVSALLSGAPDPVRQPEDPILYPEEDTYNPAAPLPGVTRQPPALPLPVLRPEAIALGSWAYGETVSRSIRRIREHGRDVLIVARHLDWWAPHSDTLRMDATTLRPIEYRVDRSNFTQYDDRKIRSESYGRSRVRQEFPDAPGVLELWQLEAVLPAFPLADQATWQVALFVHGYGFVTVPVRVVGKQGLPTPAGTFDCWVVQVAYPFGSATHPNLVRYYIERNAPNRIVGIHVRESGVSFVLSPDGAAPTGAAATTFGPIYDSTDTGRTPPR